ncbi:histidine phosphatase family protein [Leifsonia shinshuensis]|uniref:SixA phosphatase family protein n=1 Tax=Leifsonia shinshuensis TaxID=150026 RepID=UPI001F5077CD|nr:histidine phosphatase family protein [Leifsonia shinshuensis]MCI0156281.1 histidine phosphatase family protein [Leifsonia shinshuensis]
MTTTERTLILLRHAKSDWSGSEADIDRPLADRGRAQASLAGRWFAGNAGRIDLAIVSPAQRARETWELVSAEFAQPPLLRVDERVYAASAERLLDVVRDVPDGVRTVVLVGHNPGMEALASSLAGQDVILRTAGIAELAVERPWRELDASSAALRAAGRANGHDLT